MIPRDAHTATADQLDCMAKHPALTPRQAEQLCLASIRCRVQNRSDEALLVAEAFLEAAYQIATTARNRRPTWAEVSDTHDERNFAL